MVMSRVSRIEEGLIILAAADESDELTKRGWNGRA